MVVIQRLVGVTLPGVPSEGDPRGVRDWHTRRAPNLTPAVGVILRAQRVGGVAWVEAMVFTDFGTFRDRFSEDQTRTTHTTWFTAPTIDI